MFHNEDELFDWNSMVIYLCGPMDFAKDQGIGWREVATKQLLEIGFKPQNILNPCSKPAVFGGRNLSEEQKLCNEFRARKDWKGLTALVKKIMAVDLRMCDKADIILANFSHCERTTGSIHELVVCRQQHKPCYLVDEGGLDHVSGWLFALLGHERIFDNMPAAIEAIRRVKERGPISNKDNKDYQIFDFSRTDQ